MAGVERLCKKGTRKARNRSETEKRRARAAGRRHMERDKIVGKDVERERSKHRTGGSETDGRKSRGLSVPLLRKVTNDWPDLLFCHPRGERAKGTEWSRRERRGRKAPLSRESYRGGEPFLFAVVISRLSTTVNREK